MMLYRFEVDYTVPGKMGNKNYVTAVAVEICPMNFLMVISPHICR